jgi:hypothetical protein
MVLLSNERRRRHRKVKNRKYQVGAICAARILRIDREKSQKRTLFVDRLTTHPIDYIDLTYRNFSSDEESLCLLTHKLAEMSSFLFRQVSRKLQLPESYFEPVAQSLTSTYGHTFLAFLHYFWWAAQRLDFLSSSSQRFRWHLRSFRPWPPDQKLPLFPPSGQFLFSLSHRRHLTNLRDSWTSLLQWVYFSISSQPLVPPVDVSIASLRCDPTGNDKFSQIASEERSWSKCIEWGSHSLSWLCWSYLKGVTPLRFALECGTYVQRSEIALILLENGAHVRIDQVAWLILSLSLID